MSLDNLTTCPLDCYDGCSILFEDGKLKGDKAHPVTKGYLCAKMNKFLEYKRVDGASFRGKKIELQEALDMLSKKLQEFKNSNNLHFIGSGNLGKMQNITKEFFIRYGFFATEGSLCDGAGDAGIKEGRGANFLLPPKEIKKSEVVVIWGRDPSISNTHILPFLKDKKLIVIDPYKIELTKKADIHLQIKPRGDFYLALLFARIIYMQQAEDVEFIKQKCEGFEEFVELFESFSLKKLSIRCGIEVDKAWEVIDLILDSRTIFLVGIGVQKYIIGHFVLRAIDSLGAMLGLFGKDGCGISYLSDSFYGFKNPFKSYKKRVDLPTLDFSKFDIVFIQGANPAISMPSTSKVVNGLKKSKFVVYFGLYENETSKLADLVIPAVDFLSKSDIKTTYGHEYVGLMPKLKDDSRGISEYELTNYLVKTFFDEELKDEQSYIDDILSSNSVKKDSYLISKTYEDIPYKDGFYTDSKKFIFLNDFEDDYEEDYEDDEGYYLITKKHKNSLNSSFYIDNILYIPPLLGFEDGEQVEVKSDYAKAIFTIKIDKSLRNDTLMCFTGNRYYNYLTPSITSIEGKSAVFQELKVSIKKI